MQIYISNKSYNDFTSSFFKFKEKFSSPYNFSYTLIMDKKGDYKRFLKFLNQNDVIHISFLIDIEKLNYALIRTVNHFNYGLRVRVTKPLTNHQLSLLLKVKSTTLVFDENSEEEEPKYIKNKHIIYRNKKNDTIKVAHMVALSLLKVSPYDCNTSSCINKTVYYEDGNLYFCPFDKRSYIGKINELDKLYEDSGFTSILKEAISKRDTCKKTCPIYSVCTGACPLKIHDDCIKEDYLKEDKRIHEFLESKKDLRELENEVIREIVFSYISSKSRK